MLDSPRPSLGTCYGGLALLSCVQWGLGGEDSLCHMHRVAKNGEALAHSGQDDRFVIHLHLDEVGGDEDAVAVSRCATISQA